MTEATEGALLWEPSEELKADANISRYMRWLEENKRLSFESYEDLWEWSITELEEFLGHYMGILPGQGIETLLRGSR